MRRLLSWLGPINHSGLADLGNLPPDPPTTQSSAAAGPPPTHKPMLRFMRSWPPLGPITFTPLLHVTCCRASEQHCTLSKHGSRLSTVLLPADLDLAAGLLNQDWRILAFAPLSTLLTKARIPVLRRLKWFRQVRLGDEGRLKRPRRVHKPGCEALPCYCGSCGNLGKSGKRTPPSPAPLQPG